MKPRLNPDALEVLRNGRNLLGFSAGVDSTALFFLLKDAGIPFDMAMVDYGVREQSKAECDYARELAVHYEKTLHLIEAKAETANFEASARKIRYGFFARLCREEGYDSVITAHQLNDLTEWFLMQFAKGAGTVELLGMEYVSRTAEYTLARPLLDCDRDAIEAYLAEHAIPHFEDVSNRDSRYTRNAFRHRFTNGLVADYADGIRKSFALLRRDAKTLAPEAPYRQVSQFILIRRSGEETADIREIDRHLKRLGYLLSAAQREEVLRQGESVVGGKIAVALAEDFISIAPYSGSVMPKEARERFRLAGVPPKIRPYLYDQGITDALFLKSKQAILN